MINRLRSLIGLVIGLTVLTGATTNCTASEPPDRSASGSNEGTSTMDAVEQAVIVRVKLNGDDFGSSDELEALQTLEDEITDAVDGASVGEVDGSEVGGGEYVLYAYGPDADRLFQTMEPLLKSHPLARRGQATLRYGEADDPSAHEVLVELGSSQ